MASSIPGKPAEDIPGALLLDGFLQSFLLGTIVNQAFKYCIDPHDDTRPKRLFVVTVIALAVVQTMLEDYKVWRAIVLQKPWSTSPIEWSDLFLNGCICTLCESFYIGRCWKFMGKNKWLLAPLSILSTLIMAANIYLAIAMGLAFRSLAATNDTLAASHFLLPSTIVAFSFWIFGSLVLECTVTVLLTITLWRSRTGMAESDRTVIQILHLTWESAVLPALCMLVAVGLYHAAPRLDDHLVLFFVLITGKLYTFGMLRTLNSRGRLRDRMVSQDFGRTNLEGYSWGGNSTTRVVETQASLRGRADSEVQPLQAEEQSGASFGSSSTSLGFSGHTTSLSAPTPVMDARERGFFRNRITSGGTVETSG